MSVKTNLLFLVVPFVFGALAASCSQEPGVDAGGGSDAGPIDAGPCFSDTDCPGSYCNAGSRACCVPATPPYEICGDRIDQNCDRADTSCGDNDRDGIAGCMTGQDPLGGCDCDDESAAVRPPLGTVAGALEVCDDLDNDCNGRVDETAACCTGCESLGAERAMRADYCTVDGACDCEGEAGVGPCAAGLSCCSVGCVDVTTDVMNCGFCEAPCTIGSDNCVASGCRCGAGPACDGDVACTGGVCPMP